MWKFLGTTFRLYTDGTDKSNFFQKYNREKSQKYRITEFKIGGNRIYCSYKSAYRCTH